ncbi:hypothetical protein VPHF86_0202 [Vibrio phage F86]
MPTDLSTDFCFTLRLSISYPQFTESYSVVIHNTLWITRRGA